MQCIDNQNYILDYADLDQTEYVSLYFQVLMLSFALLIVPSLNPFMRSGQTDIGDKPPGMYYIWSPHLYTSHHI